MSIMSCLGGRGSSVMWGDGNSFLGTRAFADVRGEKLRPHIKAYCKSTVRLDMVD